MKGRRRERVCLAAMITECDALNSAAVFKF